MSRLEEVNKGKRESYVILSTIKTKKKSCYALTERGKQGSSQPWMHIRIPGELLKHIEVHLQILGFNCPEVKPRKASVFLLL